MDVLEHLPESKPHGRKDHEPQDYGKKFKHVVPASDFRFPFDCWYYASSSVSYQLLSLDVPSRVISGDKAHR